MRAYDAAQKRMMDGRRAMIASANGLGFSSRSVSLSAETDRFNEALAQNKIRTMQAVRAMRDWRNEQSLVRRSLRQQVALQNSVVADWGTDNRGRRMGTLFTPQNMDSGLETTRMRMQYINRLIGSAADNTIKWGKNTQWAGRQLMVGFTYPLAVIGAGTAMLAYQYEKEMARIVKVSEESSAQIRANAKETAEFVAGAYGKSAKDTLKVMGDLAAVGYEGQELQGMTEETQRLTFLGDLNPEDAVKTVTLLNTVFGRTSENIGEAVNYMNALENSTSLTMDDFVRGAPRISAIMEEMGVSFEQMGVLLNGFKSAGINAEEGARALRSVAFRTIAPRGHVLEVFEKNTGKNLQDIISQYKGEFLPTFIAIGEELKNIDSVSRSEVIRVLFGVEQGSKALELMNQLVGSTGQMARAWDVAGQSTEEWAATAEREVAAYQKSVSGRFDRALETVKTQLVDVGRPFLELGVSILNAIAPVLNFFNELPAAGKQIAMAGVIFGLLLGPVIMLGGLLANATGNVVKFASTLFGLRNTIRIVNAEEQAAMLLTQATTGAMGAQGAAAITLSQRIAILTAAIQRQAQAQGVLAATSAQVATAQGLLVGAGARTTLAPGHIGTPARGGLSYMNPIGPRPAPGFVPPPPVPPAVVRDSRTVSTNWQRGSAALATGAIAMGAIAMSQGQANEGTQNWMNMAVGVGLVATLIPGILGGVGRIGGAIANSNRATRALAGGFGRVTTAMGPVLGGALRFLGPIGIIAGGIILLKELYDHMVRIRKQQEGINTAAETWAETMGYDYKENAFGAADVETTLSRAQELSKVTSELREKNKGLVDYAQSQKDNMEEMLRLAIQQAALVRNSGGSAAQAELAAESVLMAAGVGSAQIKELMVSVGKIDWDNPEQIAAALRDNVEQYLNRAESINAKGSWDIKDWFRDDTDLTQDAGVMGTLAGQAFAEQFALAAEDPEAQNSLLTGLDKSLEADTAKLMNTLRNTNNESQAFFKERGINGPQALLSTLRAEEAAVLAEDTKAIDNLKFRGKLLGQIVNLTHAERDALEDRAGLEKTVVQAAIENLGLTEAREQGIVTLEGLTEHLGLTNEDVAAKTRDLNGALVGTGEAALVAGRGMEWLAEIGQDAAAEMLVTARRETMSSAADFIMEEAAYAHQQNFENAMDALRERGEAELAKFEGQSEALEAKYEGLNKNLDAKYDEENGVARARIRQIQDQIKAEEDAEKVRQRIFEAERKRIQRLSQLYTGNVDFNKALNEGNLDEAARVQSNMNSQVAQWGLDDQSESNPSEARIEALRKSEEAEEKALDRAKEREKEALDAAKEAERAGLDAAKKASQEKIKDREQAAQKMFEIEKRRLDRELAVLREFLPTNEAELNDWTKRVEGIYTKFGGGYLTETAGWWGGLVGTGLEKGVATSTARMKTEIKWADVGRDIANSITGVLGLNINEFMQWMKTGVLPGSGPGGTSSGATFSGGTYMNGKAVHIGGPIGWSQKDRTGVPRSASLYPSEVPAILKRGEFVVNKKATQQNMGLLQSINKGNFSNEGGVYHTGGLVGMGGMGIMSGIMGGVMAKVAQAMSQQIAGAASGIMSGGMTGGAANMLGEAALGAILSGLRMQESSNNYRARSKISSASGAYQYIKGTWNNYGGYKEAWQAPPEIQDARAAADLRASFRRYGTWEQAIAHHFYPAWAGNQSKWGQSPGKGNPTVWDYVNGVLAKAGLPGGNMAPGGQFSSAGGWPPPIKGMLSPNTRAAADYMRRMYGNAIGDIHLVGSRNNKSDHPMGKAADFMIPNWNTPAGRALGDRISNFFIQNPNAFGTKYVIWRQRINQGNGWQTMADRGGYTANHMDHPHVSFKHQGGEIGIPGLRVGGDIKYDNTIANLHKGERVLTAPLTKSLDEGLKGLVAGGGGDTFHLTVNGTASPEDKREFEAIVRNVLDERDRRNGRSRKVG